MFTGQFEAHPLKKVFLTFMIIKIINKIDAEKNNFCMLIKVSEYSEFVKVI